MNTVTELAHLREWIARFDKPGPRYTSYPTADRFVEAYDEDAYRVALQRREQLSSHFGGMAGSGPLSLYVHIPFCASICYYCACNKVITKNHGQAAKYLDYLEKEIDLTLPSIGGTQKVTHLHWGGGSPTFLSIAEIRRLFEFLRSRFELDPDGEYAIEIDPRTTAPGTITELVELGFTRLSIGVQDFDPQVQRAVHRIQPADMTIRTMEEARAAGIDSINLDLIYGLPFQTRASFAKTLDAVLALQPERIALYSYAHLPERFKPQRRINAQDLPAPQEKVELFLNAQQRLLDAGYVYIGMDHFARPDDELARAMKTGQLHRNFQGYSTQAETDLVAFGVSAISKIGTSYSQNDRSLDSYYDALDQGKLPVVRGLTLSIDDLIRRSVIMALMCQGEVSFEAIEQAYLISFTQYFEAELSSLAPFQEAGFIQRSARWLSITEVGRLFVRPIAALFDRYLREDVARRKYSKMI
ncbi:oxygen-independent coproporphyrinogen III oxidase [Ampullimonas aquatilis]|uniref:oxygen-independent coproporphyrinogen III oxidase n=1 Tax=Ampullimonas aquatilis TaxID=1341549 RepID=UPI003C7399D0